MLKPGLSFSLICLQMALLSGCNSTSNTLTNANEANNVAVHEVQPIELQAEEVIALQNRGLPNQYAILNSKHSTSPSLDSHAKVPHSVNEQSIMLDNQTNVKLAYTEQPQTSDVKSEITQSLNKRISVGTSKNSIAFDKSHIIINTMLKDNKTKPKHWNDPDPEPQVSISISCSWNNGINSCNTH